MCSATTATASARRTTWCTPGIAFALESSTLASLPPNTGQTATVATFNPGSRTSMPYCALPLTLSGESRRLAGVPMSFQSLGCLSGTSPGRDSVAARSTNAPYASVRPVGPWMTTPPVA